MQQARLHFVALGDVHQLHVSVPGVRPIGRQLDAAGDVAALAPRQMPEADDLIRVHHREHVRGVTGGDADDLGGSPVRIDAVAVGGEGVAAVPAGGRRRSRGMAAAAAALDVEAVVSVSRIVIVSAAAEAAARTTTLVSTNCFERNAV